MHLFLIFSSVKYIISRRLSNNNQMKINEFKTISITFLNKMIDGWFEGNDINNILCKSAAKSIIMAKKDGNIMIETFMDNLINSFNIIQYTINR